MNAYTKVVAAVAIAVAAIAAWVALVWVGDEEYKRTVQLLPPPVRVLYLDAVFDEPTEDCAGCYSRLVGALEALQEEIVMRGGDYGFDFVRLFPLLRGGGDSLREPIPGIACNLIMLRNDERVYRAMAYEFRADPVSLRLCVFNWTWRLKETWPERYEPVRAVVQRVPELARYFDRQ